MIGATPKGYRKGWRPCTCHPDEAPKPCVRRYALADCLEAACSPTRASPAGETDQAQEEPKTNTGEG